jgi:hypothetical protein
VTRISKPLRGRRGAQKLTRGLDAMREALRDRRVWAMIGVVVQPEDGSPHWEIVGENADVMVEVVLQPTGEPVLCRLAAGMWIVPSPGDEVAVLIADGDITFMPVVICLLASSVPATQGPAPNTIVLARGPGTKVLVHDGAGGAKELAYKSDVEAVDAKYANHLHLSPAGATDGPLSTTIPNPPNPSFPSPDSVHPYVTVVGAIPTTNPDSAGAGLEDAGIVGTSVLLAK